MGQNLQLSLLIKTAVEGLGNVQTLIGEIGRLGGSTDEAERQAADLSGELQKIGQNTALVDRFRQLAQEAAATEQALGRTQAEVTQLNRGFTQSGSAVQSQTQALETAQEAAQAANEAYRKVTQDLAALRAEMAAAGLSSTNLAAAQDRIRTELTAVTAGIGQLEARLRGSADASRQTTATVDGMTAKLSKAGAEGSAALARIEHGADTMARHVQTGAQQAEVSVKQAATGFDALGGALKGAIAQALAFFGAWQGAKEFVSLGDLWQNLSARIKLTADTQEEFNTAQKALFGIAQETRSEMEAVTRIYTRTEEAVRRLGGSQRDALDLTQTIAEAFKVSGAATGEAAAGMQQLSQALQSGVLRGDEFNSVMENAPRLAKALADGLGEPVTKLRAMAEAGELSAERVIKALLSQKDAIAKEYAQLPSTVDGALTQAKNSLLKYVGELNASYGVTQKIAGGIQALSGHLSELASVTAAAAAVYGGSLLKNVTQATAAKLEGVRASRAQAAAAAEATAATRAELQQRIASAQAQVADMRARIANTEALIAYIRAQGGQIANDATLIRLQEQLLTQQSALTAATTRQAEAQAALQAATGRTAAAATLAQRAVAGLNGAFNVATAAFIGWEIGQVLNKFELVRQAGANLFEGVLKLGTVWKVFTGELSAAQGKAEFEKIRREMDDTRVHLTEGYDEAEEKAKRFAESQRKVKEGLGDTAPVADSFAAALKKAAEGAGEGASKLGELITKYDLLKPENADKLALAMGRLGGASEGAAREVREQLLKAFQDLTGAELQAEIDGLRRKLGDLNAPAAEIAKIIDIAVREQFRRFGIDADQALTGVSAKIRDGVTGISALQSNLTAAGVTGERAGRIINQAFSNLIDSAKTTQEFDAIRQAIKNMVDTGALSIPAATQAYRDLQEAQRKAGVSAAEVAQAQAEARVKADELAQAIANGTATNAMFKDAAEASARALALQGAQAVDTGGKVGQFAAETRNAAGELTGSAARAQANADALAEMKGGMDSVSDSASNFGDAAGQALSPWAFMYQQLGVFGNDFVDTMHRLGEQLVGTNDWWSDLDYGAQTLERLNGKMAQVNDIAQRLGSNDMAALRKALDDATGGMWDTARATNEAGAYFAELGDQNLGPLNAAIQQAVDRMRQLEASAESTLNNVLDRLDQLQGRQDAVRKRQYDTEKAQIEAQRAQALAAGDTSADSKLRQALSKLDELYRLQDRKAKEDEKQQRSNPDTARMTQRFEFVGPNGRTVAGEFDPRDAQNLIQILRSAGARTF
jgi:tape measure domain-containing protein